ncbi:MAG: MarR family winged helix-turn-helix transcriptional regulator [Oscillospiraceae bacterium]|jgi:MarR family transcriptional repressor of mepA
MSDPKQIGIRLRTINHMVRRTIDSSPATKLLKNMTGTSAWLIAYIAERTDLGEDVFQKDVEEMFGVTRSTVSKMVNLMEKKGMVTRHSVKRDARLKKLVLTPEARKMVFLFRKDAEQLEDRLRAGFTDRELQQLDFFLDRIQANLEA